MSQTNEEPTTGHLPILISQPADRRPGRLLPCPFCGWRASAIFGVPAAPLLAQFARTAADAVQRGAFTAPDGEENGDVPFFSAWNVQRSSEGGKPTFAHREWVLAGHLSQASCRWLV